MDAIFLTLLCCASHLNSNTNNLYGSESECCNMFLFITCQAHMQD